MNTTLIKGLIGAGIIGGGIGMATLSFKGKNVPPAKESPEAAEENLNPPVEAETKTLAAT